MDLEKLTSFLHKNEFGVVFNTLDCPVHSVVIIADPHKYTGQTDGDYISNQISILEILNPRRIVCEGARISKYFLNPDNKLVNAILGSEASDHAKRVSYIIKTLPDVMFQNRLDRGIECVDDARIFETVMGTKFLNYIRKKAITLIGSELSRFECCKAYADAKGVPVSEVIYDDVAFTPAVEEARENRMAKRVLEYMPEALIVGSSHINPESLLLKKLTQDNIAYIAVDIENRFY